MCAPITVSTYTYVCMLVSICNQIFDNDDLHTHREGHFTMSE